jgi:ATP-dependent Clp protease ATP-binding subunit ClpA
LPLSDEAKRVLSYAAEEAQRLSHQHIDTEHLFLALLRDQSSRAAKLLLDRGVNAAAVREAIAKESVKPGISTGSGLGAVAGTQQVVEVQIVPEDKGQSLQIQWSKRIPSVGEILSVDQDDGKFLTYQIVKVEWKITAISIWPPHLAKVLIHVRELQSED